MRDIHCHIIPGVDDGSRNVRESLEMVHAAKAAGVTEIVATPHCRGSRFSMKQVGEAYRELCENNPVLPITLAFEVYYDKLMAVGIDKAPRLANIETGEMLLELPTGQLPIDFDRTLFQLQGMGLSIIIAHPERYAFVQQDISLAEDWADRGCALQVSSDFVEGNFLSKSKRTAQKLLSKGLISYIASDAHRVDHYRDLSACLQRYGAQVQHGGK